MRTDVNVMRRHARPAIKVLNACNCLHVCDFNASRLRRRDSARLGVRKRRLPLLHVGSQRWVLRPKHIASARRAAAKGRAPRHSVAASHPVLQGRARNDLVVPDRGAPKVMVDELLRCGSLLNKLLLLLLHKLLLLNELLLLNKLLLLHKLLLLDELLLL